MKDAVKKLHVDLAGLVAETALWASPRVRQTAERNGGTLFGFPVSGADEKASELGSVINGIGISDGAYAHATIKEALGTKHALSGMAHATFGLVPGTAKDIIPLFRV